MRPLSVNQLLTVIGGELEQGSKDILIRYGAYRLKQVKEANTVLFLYRRIINWDRVKDFSPIIVVTEWKYSLKDVPKNVVLIKVDNLQVAYWRFVYYYRGQFNLPVIAITGTSGKTTTKEMIKHILSEDKKVIATHLSTNSRTANLQYLLSIDDKTEVAVFETAVGSPGDVLKAGEYFKPTIGIITNIGAHHLNYCKTLEGYIEAKAEMLQILKQGGTLILNVDDANIRKLNTTPFLGKMIKIGKQDVCQYKISNIRYGREGMHFIVSHGGNQYEGYIPGFGEHQVYNAVAAIAAAHQTGVSIPSAITRLTTFRKMNKQLQLFKGIHSSLILDDTWSITTTSLEAAIKVLESVGKDKKKIAIIGTITDLGSWGYRIHEQAGEIIYRHDVDVLVTVGEHARIIGEHAKKLGLSIPIYGFNNSILAYELLEKIIDERTIVLIKGDMYSETMRELASKLKKKKSPPS
ncbi:Mur ligase family protein [Lysinibacillus sp. 54212]|uniref:Mur ligase family protein n=1 Tax=Lysinibacillus sp. 54212 TaxID=3119829 RepID=UPI002FC9BDB3